jgi:hypothetical protein
VSWLLLRGLHCCIHRPSIHSIRFDSIHSIIFDRSASVFRHVLIFGDEKSSSVWLLFQNKTRATYVLYWAGVSRSERRTKQTNAVLYVRGVTLWYYYNNISKEQRTKKYPIFDSILSGTSSTVPYINSSKLYLLLFTRTHTQPQPIISKKKRKRRKIKNSPSLIINLISSHLISSNHHCYFYSVYFACRIYLLLSLLLLLLLLLLLFC